MNLAPNKYAEQVKSGKIVAGIYIHQAIARHEADLKRADIYFDHDAGAYMLGVVSNFKHTKGKWKNKNFEPLPWQQWLIYILFGWMLKNGTRRFRTAYFEVARKNGKSTLMAVIGNCLFLADDEAGPEIYTGATTKDQAKIVFKEAKAMVLNNKNIKPFVKVFEHHMELKNDPVSIFKPTSREAKNMDGLNPSGAIIDEYHAHKTSEIYDIFKSGMGSRENPMQLTITTAGFNKGAPCYQLRKTCIDILSGKKKDDSLFIMIFAPDPGDDWTLQRTWKKANPSVGKTIKMDYLKRQFIQAKNNVTEQVSFKTKNVNMWSETSSTWIESSRWDAAKKQLHDNHLQNWECFAALDLASVRDIIAFPILFINGENLFVKSHFFIPEDTARKRSKEDGVAYEAWVLEKYLIATPGNVADYKFIEDYIVDVCEKYNVTSLAYDDWNSSYIVTNLMARGIECNKYSQRYSHMNFPVKEIDRKIHNGTLHHDGNPVMNWMIGNVEITHDSSGNIKIDKARSAEKVDGPVAVAMSIGEWVTSLSEPEEENVYNDRGFLEIK